MLKFKFKKRNNKNSLMVIFPYKIYDTWVFDDSSKKLKTEPFILGISEMIDKITSNIPNAQNGFKLIFSSKPFPDYQTKFNWVKKERNGNWYKDIQNQDMGWLCPALYKYFKKAPKQLYVKAEPKY